MCGHGTYERVEPEGMEVRRWYCRSCHTTFSALPDCLACGVRGTLEEIEKIAVLAEASGKMAAVRFFFDSHVDPVIPWRFVRRRCGWMEGLLRMLPGLLPMFFGMEPTLADLRARLDSETALRDLREHCHEHLGSIRFRVGCRLPRWGCTPPWGPPTGAGHGSGPDGGSESVSQPTRPHGGPP
ncbi:MAG: hypothetical protein OXN16_06835 [Gammaproteobacteria bacterium]|nr:hypothetical protein [Gammaproteobacteria bacterium]